MTVEPTPTLSREDAQRLTQRIQLIAGNAREAMEKLSLLVEQARSGRAHAALGFASWTDYRYVVRKYMARSVANRSMALRVAERCMEQHGVMIDIDAEAVS